MSLTLKIEGNSPEETKYMKKVLSQAFPHWVFIDKTETGNFIETAGISSVECHFENIESIDNGVLQQKRAIKEQYPDLIKEGIETFETEEEFFAWMVKPSYGLHGKVPLTLVASGKIDEVLMELKRIQYGDLS